MPPSSRASAIYPLSFFRGNVFAAFSGREYPRAHFSRFLQDAGLDPQAFFRPKQVHGSAITVISSDMSFRAQREISPFKNGISQPLQGFEMTCEVDAILTNVSGPVLGIITADCIPAFFWDPAAKAAGLAHAGWRGLKAGILEKMVLKMEESFDSKAENIQIFFGDGRSVIDIQIDPFLFQYSRQE